MDRPHRVCVRVIPFAKFFCTDNLIGWVTLRKCLNECLFDWSCVTGKFKSLLHSGITIQNHIFCFVFTQKAPWQVVERAACKGDPPVGHCASGVDLNSLAKTERGLFMIKPIDPSKSSIEPSLCLWCRHSDWAGIFTQMKRIGHLIFSMR